MTGNNKIFIENKKVYETVQELKDEYKTPSFEEFMKDYKADDDLNYDDLNSGSVYEVRGFGPCSECNNSKTFKLTMVLKNCVGSSKGGVVYNVDDAHEEAGKILSEIGHWDDEFPGHFFSSEDRQKLVNRINSAIYRHVNCDEDINEVVCNKG